MGQHDGISALNRSYAREHASSLCCVRTQKEEGNLQARRWPVIGTESASTLIFDFLVSRFGKNKCLLYKLPSLWY